MGVVCSGHESSPEGVVFTLDYVNGGVGNLTVLQASQLYAMVINLNKLPHWLITMIMDLRKDEGFISISCDAYANSASV